MAEIPDPPLTRAQRAQIVERVLHDALWKRSLANNEAQRTGAHVATGAPSVTDMAYDIVDALDES